MWDVSCDIWDLENVINVVRHYILGDGRVFPGNQHATIDIALINLRPSFPKLINYKHTHNQPYCVPHLPNFIKLFNSTPNHNPTHRYFCAGDTI